MFLFLNDALPSVSDSNKIKIAGASYAVCGPAICHRHLESRNSSILLHLLHTTLASEEEKDL